MAKIRLSEKDKVYIAANADIKSIGKIADEINRTRSTVQSFLRKWKSTFRISNIKPSGRPRYIFGKRLEKRIIRLMLKNKSTLKEAIYKLGLHCSVSFLSSFLRKRGYGSYKEIVKAKLSPSQVRDRLQFANKYISWTDEKWKKVIFADSSSIQLDQKYKGYIWRKKGQFVYSSQPRTFIKRYIKVFSAVSYYGKANLIFVNNPFNAKAYKKMWEDNYNDIMMAVNPHNYQMFLLHDNEKIHTSEIAQSFFRIKKLKMLKEYPSNSGDLNIIEHCWYLMKKEINKSRSKTIEKLKINSVKAWDKINIHTIQSMIDSMNKRIMLLKHNLGYNLKY